MEYRLGQLKDINSIMILIREAIKEMERYEIYQWDDIYPSADDFEKDILTDNLYIVEENEELIAFYVISDEADEAYDLAEWKCAKEDAYILHRFCVSPRHQNKGFGRQILLYIEAQIKNMGYKSVRLDVFTENPFAQRLYRKNGYEARGFADWRKGRFDLMEKIL